MALTKPIDTTPWWKGSGNVATLTTRNDMARRAREILEGDDYKASLLRRIKNDDLAPAVETMLYYYAYGKPAETVVVEDNTSKDLTSLPVAELEQVLLDGLRQLRELQAQEASIPAEFKVA